MLSPNAQAVLGEKETSIEQDRTKVHSAARVRTQSPHYTSHVLAGSLVTVTEFVNSDGVVFAVSWHGIIKPDLQSLLGSFYEEFHALDAARARTPSRHPTQINTSKAVVLRSGHMRDIRGTAYIPSLVPADVNIGTLN
jgi:hypothetical protein